MHREPGSPRAPAMLALCTAKQKRGCWCQKGWGEPGAPQAMCWVFDPCKPRSITPRLDTWPCWTVIPCHTWMWMLKHAGRIALLSFRVLLYKCHGKFTWISWGGIKKKKTNTQTKPTEELCFLTYFCWFVLGKIASCRCHRALSTQCKDVSSRKGEQFCHEGFASHFLHISLLWSTPCMTGSKRKVLITVLVPLSFLK